MGRSEPGRLGSGESATEHSAGARWWRIAGGDHLSAFQRGLPEGASVCERGKFGACGLGRCRTRSGPRGGGVGDPGDGDFGAGFDELVGLERGAGALCDGARWNFFQDCGWDSSEVPDTGAGADFSVRAGEPDGTDGNV